MEVFFKRQIQLNKNCLCKYTDFSIKVKLKPPIFKLNCKYTEKLIVKKAKVKRHFYKN